MKILVNGVRLWFDVEGAALRPEGPRMAARPTLLLLHGGPGIDHSMYRPHYAALADVAQVIYLDHRGNGRSDAATPATWTLAQWADDVRAFCDALGIEKPIVAGTSFGGMVAMAYATRHPDHPAKLILASTAARPLAHAEAKVAMFERRGGPEAGALARRRFVDGDSSPEVLAQWLRIAVPLYTVTPPDPDAPRRFVLKPEVTAWFNRPGGDARTVDLRADLARLRCPTLLIGGRLDPMLPIECQREIAAAVPAELLTYREFDDAGHGVVPDLPEAAFALMREFIAG